MTPRAGVLLSRRFWLVRLGRIFWPYVLWMTVEALLLAAFSDVTTMGQVAFDASTYLLAPISPFWFLYALCLCHVFTHVVSRLGPEILMGGAVAVFGFGQMAGRPELVHLVTWGLLWFVVGSLSASTVRIPHFAAQLGRPSVLLSLAGATIALALLFLGWGIPNRLNIPAAITGGGTVFCLAMRLSLARLTHPAIRVIRFLGQISLTVLVTRILGTAATRIFLAPALHVRSIWLQLTAGVLIGLALPVVVQTVFARLGLLRLIGLPRVDFTLRRAAAVAS